MRLRRSIPLLLLVAAASCAKDSPTGPTLKLLGTASFFGSGLGSFAVIHPLFTAGTSFGPNPALFDTIAVDSSKIGLEFEASAANDTDFVKVATSLADGAAGSVCAGGCDASCLAECSNEKDFFHLGTANFAPATVEEMTLHVDSTSVVPSPFGGTLRQFFFTLSVFGKR